LQIYRGVCLPAEIIENLLTVISELFFGQSLVASVAVADAVVTVALV